MINYNMAIGCLGVAIGHAINANWLGMGLMSSLVLLNIGFYLVLVKMGHVK